jgi:hypothetical protein
MSIVIFIHSGIILNMEMGIACVHIFF